MIGLSYPLAWTPLAIVLGVLVLLNSYLALIALLLVACFVLAAVAALVWVGVSQLFARLVHGRHARSSRGAVEPESHRESAHS